MWVKGQRNALRTPCFSLLGSLIFYTLHLQNIHLDKLHKSLKNGRWHLKEDITLTFLSEAGIDLCVHIVDYVIFD